MSRMDISPEEVMEEIDNLSQAMLGMGRRTQLERYSSVSMTQSPFSPDRRDLGSSQRNDVREGWLVPRFQEELGARSSENPASFAEQSHPTLSSSVANEPSIPSTTLRKNITTRRSRGRQDEPAKDPKDLVGFTKRTQGRAEDQAYRRASLGGLLAKGIDA